MAVSSSTSSTSSSGIDVNAIVSQLMTVERQPLQALQSKQASLQSKISAFGSLKSSYSAIGDAVGKLSAPDAFKAVTTTSSDPTTVSATAAAGTGVGSFGIEVTQLAQAQKLASAAFSSIEGAIGTGTLNIQLGTFAAGTFTANGVKPAVSIPIGAGQNTLSGIRDAINRADAGVRASIVNDGTGYRLALSSTDTGTSNSMRITVADDDGNHLNNAGLSQLAFDPAGSAGAGKNLEQKSAAQDAIIKIDGISVVKPGNTIADAIAGVSLTLFKVTSGTPVTVTVAPDAAATKSALDALVANFNSFQASVKSLTGYNAATKTGGLLSGDAVARSLLDSLKSALTTSIPGLGSTPSTLSAIGLAFQQNGTLALDAAKFNKAYADPNANLAALFSAVGVPSDTRVQFTGATDATPAGSYAINVTQAATRGLLTGGAAANLTISSGVNDTLGISINGVSATVTLAAGTYTADSLAAELQSRLNGASTLRNAGITVTASQSGGVLTLQSAVYGSGSSVSAASGNAAADLFGATPTSTAGLDVAGTIGGIAAIGTGRSLKTTAGLVVSVNAAATGAFGTLNFNRGYASRISAMVSGALKSDGAFANRSDGLARSVKDIQTQQDRFNARMTTVESALRKQYTALDSMLSSMNSTSTYLTQQLSKISAQSTA